MKLAILVVTLTLFLPSLFANEIDIGVNYLHYRTESSQTGQPSEFLFDVAPQAYLNYSFNFFQSHSLSLGVDYAELEVDTSNVSLFVNETEFSPLNFHGKYEFWIRHGILFSLYAGQKSIPLYDIENQGVTFTDFKPLYWGAGVALRAKNTIGTLEASYFYKQFLDDESVSQTWTGNSQQIRIHFNAGREKLQRGKHPGFLGRVYYTHYRSPALEGWWGIHFDYNFTHLKSEYEYKVDERIFGLYIKYRFTDNSKRE